MGLEKKETIHINKEITLPNGKKHIINKKVNVFKSNYKGQPTNRELLEALTSKNPIDHTKQAKQDESKARAEALEKENAKLKLELDEAKKQVQPQTNKNNKGA